MFRVTTRLRFIQPQLASPVDQPPEGKHWIHEIKHDGYRSQVVIERGQVRVFSRNGHDWSDRYPSLTRAAASLRCKSAIIDGEAIVQNGDSSSGSLADIRAWIRDVRFTLKSGHTQSRHQCLLSAISGLRTPRVIPCSSRHCKSDLRP